MIDQTDRPIVAATTGEARRSTSAPGLLAQAGAIMAERGKQYDADTGQGERSMAKTTAIFNLATGRDLSEAEGWFFMECLKNVRLWQNTDTPHEDSLHDKIAYSALLAECALTKGLK